MTLTPEYVQRVHDLAREARGHQDHVTVALGSILYLSQEQLGTAVPVSENAKRCWPRVGLLITIGLLSLAVGAGYSLGGKPMAKTLAQSEIELVTAADTLAAAGDFAGVQRTAKEMNVLGLKSDGAYWEGVAHFNFGHKEEAAQFFILAHRYGHPLAAVALEKVRAR